MKCICTKTCQFRGVTFEGEVREMTAEEFEKPFVRAHFRALSGISDFRSQISEGGAGEIAADGAGAGKARAAEAADGAGADKARAAEGVEVAGKVLPMTRAQLLQKAAELGLKTRRGASDAEVYAAVKAKMAPSLELK